MTCWPRWPTELAGKIVVDCVNPLGFDQRGAYALPVAEGSAAQQAAALLPGSRVVAAFHHVSAVLLLDPEVDTIDLDVLVLGDDREATDLVQALAARSPACAASTPAACATRPDRGADRQPGSINRRYKAHAGLRVTDIYPERAGVSRTPEKAAAVMVAAVRTRLPIASSGQSRHRSVSENKASALIIAARSCLSWASRSGQPRVPAIGSSAWLIRPNRIPGRSRRRAQAG